MKIDPTTKTLLFAIAVGLCAAATTAAAQAPTKPVPDSYKKALAAYISCVKVSTDSLAAGAGLPADIASAAIGECGREYDAYRNAGSDFSASVVPKRAQAAARRSADAESAAFREELRDFLVSRVLRARQARDAALVNPGRAALADFVDCVSDAAKSRVGGPATASDIADAAVSQCTPEYEAFRSAVAHQHESENEETRQRFDALVPKARENARREMIDAISEMRRAQ